MLTGDAAARLCARLRRGRVLGRGMMGTVYATNDPNLVLKVARELPKDAAEHRAQLAAFSAGRRHRPRGELARECAAARRGGARLGACLLPLAVVVARCEHTQEYAQPIETLLPRARARFERIAASPWCSLKVYQRIDGTLKRLGELSPRGAYAVALQLVAAVRALHAAGYVHGDLHLDNVGWVRTPAKVLPLRVDGRVYRVPSYGRRLVLIDNAPMRRADCVGKEVARFDATLPGELHWLLLMFLADLSPFWDWVHAKRIRLRPEKEALARFEREHAGSDAALRAAGVGDWWAGRGGAAGRDGAVFARYARFRLFAVLSPAAHEALALGERYVAAARRGRGGSGGSGGGGGAPLFPPRLRAPLSDLVEVFRRPPERLAEFFAEKLEKKSAIAKK